MLDHREIARVLREIGQLLQLKGENAFKTKAYETAAQRFEDLTDERFEELVQSRQLEQLQGVGEAISKKVTTLYDTGSLPYYDNLRAEFPPDILELLRVPDLGPKKAAALWRELQIGSVDQLAEACRAGKVRDLKGFGIKTETKLLQAIELLRQTAERRPLGEARPIAAEIAQRIRGIDGVAQAEFAGSTRRFRETVADIDVIVAATDPDPVFDAVEVMPSVARTLARGDTKCSVVLRDGLQIDVRVVPVEAWATALHHFTGSKNHHVRLRGRARDRGLTISEYGVARIADGTKLPIQCEADLYQALDLAFVPPELREDTGEIEAALEGRLPQLLEESDLQGYVHVHTRDSDGSDTILQMARAVEARGGRYLTITDHSRSAGYASGLDLDRLAKQREALAEAQEQVPGVRLLHGSEVDILENGTLDFPEDVLAGLDVVIASVHSRLKMDEEAMTKRLLAAMDNPFVDILGHPTGRLLGKRPAYAVKMDAILERAATRGVAIEINGVPERLDLSAEHARQAIARGVKLVVSTDAHSVAGLGWLEYAVGTARRGWATKGDVLNCLSADDFLRALRRAEGTSN